MFMKRNKCEATHTHIHTDTDLQCEFHTNLNYALENIKQFVISPIQVRYKSKYNHKSIKILLTSIYISTQLGQSEHEYNENDKTRLYWPPSGAEWYLIGVVGNQSVRSKVQVEMEAKKTVNTNKFILPDCLFVPYALTHRYTIIQYNIVYFIQHTYICNTYTIQLQNLATYFQHLGVDQGHIKVPLSGESVELLIETLVLITLDHIRNIGYHGIFHLLA